MPAVPPPAPHGINMLCRRSKCKVQKLSHNSHTEEHYILIISLALSNPICSHLLVISLPRQKRMSWNVQFSYIPRNFIFLNLKLIIVLIIIWILFQGSQTPRLAQSPCWNARIKIDSQTTYRFCYLVIETNGGHLQQVDAVLDPPTYSIHGLADENGN